MDCWQQLLIMLYAQIKELSSLREIRSSLEVHSDKWSHLGLQTVARSTLSDANAQRPYQMYEELFYAFLQHCQALAPGHKFRVRMPVFTQDSTTIPLCLSAFPWARYRRRKGAMKLHMLIDHEGCLPSFVRMTDGKVHDIRVTKDPQHAFPALPPDSILTIDRGYIDYAWLHSLHQQDITFIVRAKSNMAYRVVGQHAPAKKRRGVLADQAIEFTNFYEEKAYPERLRLIRYWDREHKKELCFLTNNFELAATTIAALYKGRWQIETFFKWIKQNLRVKTFLGTSPNAVMTQVWIALICYLLLSFIKFQTRYGYPLLELLRVVREVLLERTSLIAFLKVNHERLCAIRAAPVQMAFY
jgi:transposase